MHGSTSAMLIQQRQTGVYKDQLFLYEHLAQDHSTKFRLIRSRTDLDQHLTGWKNYETLLPDLPVGLVLLMEGAEAITSPGELDFWWEHGVRIIGPAWAGNRFCGGTGEPSINPGGSLAKANGRLGFILIYHTWMDRQQITRIPIKDRYSAMQMFQL